MMVDTFGAGPFSNRELCQGSRIILTHGLVLLRFSYNCGSHVLPRIATVDISAINTALGSKSIGGRSRKEKV